MERRKRAVARLHVNTRRKKRKKIARAQHNWLLVAYLINKQERKLRRARPDLYRCVSGRQRRRRINLSRAIFVNSIIQYNYWIPGFNRYPYYVRRGAAPFPEMSFIRGAVSLFCILKSARTARAVPH